MTFKEAKADLKENGITLTYKPEWDEYRANFVGGREATAYYSPSLDDAFYTGMDMATFPKGR